MAQLLEGISARTRRTEAAMEKYKLSASAAESQLKVLHTEHGASLAKMRQQNETKCSELRQQMLDVMQERDRLKSQSTKQASYVPVEPQTVFKPHIASVPSSSRWILMTTLAVAVVSFLTLQSPHYQEHTVNSLCAPARPHTLWDATTTDATTIVWEAPWWAPPAYKETAFAMVCGPRTRVRLTLSSDQVTATHMAGRFPITLWHKSADQVQVFASEVALERTVKGKSTVALVDAPWVMRKRSYTKL
jgi:hypothetical protein